MANVGDVNLFELRDICKEVKVCAKCPLVTGSDENMCIRIGEDVPCYWSDDKIRSFSEFIDRYKRLKKVIGSMSSRGKPEIKDRPGNISWKEWQKLKIGQTIYYGKHRTPRKILEKNDNSFHITVKKITKNTLFDKIHTCFNIYDRYQFYLTKEI